MDIPKQLQNKPLTQDLVSGMSAIVGYRRGNLPADSRDQVRTDGRKPAKANTRFPLY